MQMNAENTSDLIEIPQEPTKKHKLTIKQKILIRELVRGKSLRTASEIAGLHESYACNILKEPQLREAFKDKLEAAGLTDSALAEQIKNLAFGAKKTMFFAHQGEVVDEREVEALDIQADMTKFAAKLKGHVIDRSRIEAPGIEEILQEIADRRKGG
jgi:hypothetical protein